MTQEELLRRSFLARPVNFLAVPRSFMVLIDFSRSACLSSFFLPLLPAALFKTISDLGNILSAFQTVFCDMLDYLYY